MIELKRTYRRYDPEQTRLMPTDLRKWLPDDHLSLFIDDLVNGLDLSAFYAYYERSDRGSPPYDPRMMVKILIYAYSNGINSSRKIQKEMVEDIGFRYLGANNFPDFRTICLFRSIHMEPIMDLFGQVLLLCENANMVKMGVVALDGTKVKANASLDRNRTKRKLSEDRERMEAMVRELLEKADRADETEDLIYGDYDGYSLPEGFRTGREQLDRIKEAERQIEERELEEESKERKKRERYLEGWKNKEREAVAEGRKLPGRRPKELTLENPEGTEEKDGGERETSTEDGGKEEGENETGETGTENGEKNEKEKKGERKKEVRRNTTDPDSRIMKTGNGYVQGYNCQAMADCESKVIVYSDVTDDENDLHQLRPMLEGIIRTTGRAPDRLTADAGYFYEDEVEAVMGLKKEEDVNEIGTGGNDGDVGTPDPVKEMMKGTKLYIATRNRWKEKGPPPKGRIPKDHTTTQRMERKLRTKEGKEIYGERAPTIEPVFGNIKYAIGFKGFVLRRKEKVRFEWVMACMGHNIKKLEKKLRGVKKGGIKVMERFWPADVATSPHI